MAPGSPEGGESPTDDAVRCRPAILFGNEKIRRSYAPKGRFAPYIIFFGRLARPISVLNFLHQTTTLSKSSVLTPGGTSKETVPEN